MQIKQAIEKDGALYLLYDDKIPSNVPLHTNAVIYFIPASTYGRVSNFVGTFRKRLDELNETKNGKSEYCEKNWHNRLVCLMSDLLPTHERMDISAALASFGL